MVSAGLRVWPHWRAGVMPLGAPALADAVFLRQERFHAGDPRHRLRFGGARRGRGKHRGQESREVRGRGHRRWRGALGRGATPGAARFAVFLNENLGWLATDKGIWVTTEAGREWRKLPKSPEGVLRVHFLDEKNGFAVGIRRMAMATHDGGEHWAAIPEGAKQPGDPRYSAYSWIVFPNPQVGLIAGWNIPPDPSLPRRPDWVDPEATFKHRELPHLALSLQTHDGGRTWIPHLSLQLRSHHAGALQRHARRTGPGAVFGSVRSIPAKYFDSCGPAEGERDHLPGQERRGQRISGWRRTTPPISRDPCMRPSFARAIPGKIQVLEGEIGRGSGNPWKWITARSPEAPYWRGPAARCGWPPIRG